MFDTNAYLRRIDYAGPVAPTLATLRALHRAHHLSVPFENLDIHLGRAIALDEELLFDKIVMHRRGGFCYELNGLFARLLRELGFRVTLLSAGVWDSGSHDFGPVYDHLLLRVDLDEPWLADVGFGDAFLEPIRLNHDEQRDGERGYRLDTDGDRLILMEHRPGADWLPQHAFDLRPRELHGFARMCRFHQTSPDSHFTHKPVISRATPTGRVTLSDGRLIVTERGQRQERQLDGNRAIQTALRDHFGVSFDTAETETAFGARLTAGE